MAHGAALDPADPFSYNTRPSLSPSGAPLPKRLRSACVLLLAVAICGCKTAYRGFSFLMDHMGSSSDTDGLERAMDANEDARKIRLERDERREALAAGTVPPR